MEIGYVSGSEVQVFSVFIISTHSLECDFGEKQQDNRRWFCIDVFPVLIGMA